MYYSQHGEDFILDKVFKNINDGFFVEIGCIDGRRFSNTLFFEEKGWKGITVEAHPDYIESLTVNRPNSEVVPVAVGSDNKSKVNFYADRRGSLSSLDKAREKELKRDYSEYFSGYEPRVVEMRTLTSIFEEKGVKNIDFVSLDIEGGELDALNGLDFSKFKPSVFVIEFDSLNDISNLKKILTPHGYSLALILSNNLFFTTSLQQFEVVLEKKFPEVNLLHTGNKFDSEPDVEKIVTIDTTKKAQLKQRFKVLIHGIKHKIKDIIRIYD